MPGVCACAYLTSVNQALSLVHTSTATEQQTPAQEWKTELKPLLSLVYTSEISTSTSSLRTWRSCEKAESSMRRIRFLAPCWTWNLKGGEKLEVWGWGRGGERPPAWKLAFSSSPSAGGREILIGSLTVMSIKICQPSNSHTTAGAAMWWKNVCLYLILSMFLRNANGKINLKEEQKPVVKEMLFGSSGLPEMF